jgi:predicted Zn-dependent peptidase
MIEEMALHGTLPNGMSYYICEAHNSSYAVVQILVNTSLLVPTADETSCPAGIAHVVEHVLFSAQGKSIQDAFRGPFEMGAKLNGFTDNNVVCYHLTVPPESIEKALVWLLKSVVPADWRRLGPRLRATLAHEKPVVNQEYRNLASEAKVVLQNALLANVFPGHPLGRNMLPTSEEIDGLTMKDVRAHLAKYYVPANMCIGVCVPGTAGTSGAAVEAMVKARAATSAAAQRPTFFDAQVAVFVPPPAPLGPPAPLRLAFPDRNYRVNVTAAIAEPFSLRSHVVYSLLAYVLGQASPINELFQSLRLDKRLIYKIECALEEATSGRYISIECATTKGKVADVVAGIAGVVRANAKGTTAGAFAIYKRNFVQMLRQKYTGDNYAWLKWASLVYKNEGAVVTLDQLLEVAGSVRAAEVAGAARAMAGTMRVGVAGRNAKRIKMAEV